MTSETLTDRIVQRQVSLGLLVGILLIVFGGIATLGLQLTGVIDLSASVTEIWILVISGILGIGAGLITRAIVQPPNSTIKRLKTQTQGVPTLDREREDFRNSVATEVHSLLKLFIDPLHHWDINYPSWSSKAEQSKAAILGKEDYLVLRSLYDAIEERNKYFAGRHGMDLAKVDPLNRQCVEAFSRAYGDVTWLKISSDTDSLLSKARKNAGLL